MYYRKEGDLKKLGKLFKTNPKRRYRPCGVYHKNGRLCRYYKSDSGSYKFFKRAARRHWRKMVKQTLEDWPKTVYDLPWKWY